MGGNACFIDGLLVLFPTLQSCGEGFLVDRSEMIETMVERLAMGWGKEFYQTILGLGCYKKLIKVEYCDLLYITRPGQGFDSAGSRTHDKAGLALCRSSEASMGRGRRELAEVSQR